MTTFHFQTHVSDSGVITLPPQAENLYGKVVVVNVDLPSEQKPKRSFEEKKQTAKDRTKKQERKRAFEELCDAWCADERSTEEIIRDIYESRTIGRERDPL